MFDVGFSELVLIFVLGLLILGPERLPRVAAQLGRWVGKARHMATQLRRQLEHELEVNEIRRPSWPPPPKPPGQTASQEKEKAPDASAEAASKPAADGQNESAEETSSSPVTSAEPTEAQSPPEDRPSSGTSGS